MLPDESMMNMTFAGMSDPFWLKKISVSSAKAANVAAIDSTAPETTAKTRDLENRMM
jgi:hypothetical protein